MVVWYGQCITREMLTQRVSSGDRGFDQPTRRWPRRRTVEELFGRFSDDGLADGSRSGARWGGWSNGHGVEPKSSIRLVSPGFVSLAESGSRTTSAVSMAANARMLRIKPVIT